MTMLNVQWWRKESWPRETNRLSSHSCTPVSRLWCVKTFTIFLIFNAYFLNRAHAQTTLYNFVNNKQQTSHVLMAHDIHNTAIYHLYTYPYTVCVYIHTTHVYMHKLAHMYIHSQACILLRMRTYVFRSNTHVHVALKTDYLDNSVRTSCFTCLKRHHNTVM